MADHSLCCGYIAPYAKVGIGRRLDEKGRLSFRAGGPITDDSLTSGPVTKRPEAVNLNQLDQSLRSSRFSAERHA